LPWKDIRSLSRIFFRFIFLLNKSDEDTARDVLKSFRSLVMDKTL
jgi:hypothetical protein